MVESFKRFFTCPLDFDESEELLQFRFTMLMIMVMLITAYTVVYAVLDFTVISTLGPMQRYVNLFHAALGVFLFFYIRRSKRHYTQALYILLLASFIAFSLAVIFVPEDEFRLIWFFILIIGTYIVGDIKLGTATSLGGLIVIVTLNEIYTLEISHMALFSIIGSYLVVSFFMFAYTKRMDRFQDELIEKNMILERLATYDSLTDIMNRRLFLEMANKHLQSRSRETKDLYFLMLDIDHFKQINDNYGHSVGDEVLRNYAKTVTKIMRTSDLFGRLGGEEFGVVLMCSSKADATGTAERIRSEVEASRYRIEPYQITVTTSIGLVKATDSETLPELMKRADEALYRAKAEGRNCVVYGK